MTSTANKDNDMNITHTTTTTSSAAASDVFARLLSSAPPYRTHITNHYPTSDSTTTSSTHQPPLPLGPLANMSFADHLSLSSSESDPLSNPNPSPLPPSPSPATATGIGPASALSSAVGSRLRHVALSSSEPSIVHGFQRLTVSRGPEHPTDSVRQILRELREMNKENFDNHQVRVTMKEDDPRHLIVTLTPDDGLYADGHYEISMTFPDDYPHSKPRFHCNTPIFHPNIAYDGGICFSLLEENETFLRIADYAHGLLWLMYYPNLYSRVNMDCPRDGNKFSEMVRRSIEGGVVCDRVYERSVRLPKKEEEKEEEKGSVCCGKMRNGKNGKKWEWKLINKEWVQVFIEECQCASAASCDE